MGWERGGGAILSSPGERESVECATDIIIKKKKERKTELDPLIPSSSCAERRFPARMRSSKQIPISS